MSKKKKLVFTMPTLQMGGAERVLATLVNHWALHKTYDMTIVVHDHASNGSFYKFPSSVKIIYTGLWKSKKWRIPFECYRIFKELKPDLVVGFILWNNILTILASKVMGIPCIISERSSPHVVRNRFIRFMRHVFYKKANTIVVQTQRGKNMFSRIIASKTAVIGNPISSVAAKKSPKKMTLITAGRLSKEKDFSTLINAFSIISNDFAQWDLVIFGEGPERPILENLIKSKGLEKRIFLPGRTQNILQEMSQASIFILSSKFEGMPNALAEAMAIGLPAISTDCPTGPRELIEHGHDGFLVPVGDASAMADAMRRLMNDKKLRQEFGEKAREKMKQYNTEAIAKLWENEFQKVIGA